MTERPAVSATLRLASDAAIEKRRRLKCDRDVKLHLPEALYDDLAWQARADSRAVSEYIRVLLERPLYGMRGVGGH
jgi:hypothetical protein